MEQANESITAKSASRGGRARRQVVLAFWVATVGTIVSVIGRALPPLGSDQFLRTLLDTTVPPFVFPGRLFPIVVLLVAGAAVLLRRGTVEAIVGATVLLVYFLAEHALLFPFLCMYLAPAIAYLVSFLIYGTVFVLGVRGAVVAHLESKREGHHQSPGRGGLGNQTDFRNSL